MAATLGCDTKAPEIEQMAIAQRLIDEDPSNYLDRAALLDQATVETWSFAHAADLEPWEQQRFDRKFELGSGELILHSTKRHPRLRREVDWDTGSIDALVLEVPEFARGVGRLYWAGEGEKLSEERSLTGRSVDDTYPLSLVFDLAFHPEWRGRVQRIAIELFSPDSGQFRLRKVRVVRYQPVEERVAVAASESWKIDLDHEVRNGLLALPGAPVTRRLEIPSKAVLRVGFAIDRTARQAIVFSGSLAPEGGGTEATPLFSTIVGPDQPLAPGQWHDLEVDLSAAANSEATLRLETRALEGDHDLVHSFAFWSSPEVLHPAVESRPNVVVISIDTLRADHLQSYGYHRATAPRLDAWAKRRATTFRNVVAPSPWTIPSHVSMFSGLDALRHGVNHPEQIPDRLELLAELFRGANYATLAITGGGFMRPQRGFAQGFERYRYWPDPKSEDELDAGVDCALKWIDDVDDRPFLLFFHTFEVHYPYRRREPFFTELAGEKAALGPEVHLGFSNVQQGAEDGFLLSKEFFWKPEKEVLERNPMSEVELRELVDRYDSGIAYADARLARLLARLEEDGLDRRTVVIVTSDHGEALGERGFAGHAYLYDWNLLVPLLIATPEGGGKQIETQVRTVDLLPTITELAGLDVPADLDGASLVPLLAGRPASHPRTAWSYVSFSNRGLALRFDNRLKYFYNNTAWPPLHGQEQLYDLRLDPHELDDLAGGSRETTALRRQAHLRLAETTAGLAVRFANASAHTFSGRIAGGAIHPARVKAVALPAGALRWRETGSADFQVQPGDDFLLLFERPQGRLDFTGTIEGASAGPGSAIVFDARLKLVDLEEAFPSSPSSGAWQLSHSSDGWTDGLVEESPEGIGFSGTGITVRWHGGAGPSAAGPASDAQLNEQLRALGYVP